MDLSSGTSSEPSSLRTSSAGGTGAGITLIALAFGGGIALGHYQPVPRLWIWLAVASGLLMLSIAARHYSRLWMTLVLGSTFFLGSAWYVLQHHHLAPNDLAAMLGEDAVLVHVRGVALGQPETRDRTGGSMARYDYRSPASYFPMRIKALIDRDGEETMVQGRVQVRVNEIIAPFHAGDSIELRGYLRAPGPPKNPGEYDFQRWSRSLGQAGLLTVPGRELLLVTPRPGGALRGRFLSERQSLRRRASGALLADLPGDDDGRRAALLSALLLGRREMKLQGVSEAFQRVGLAHLLAISGLHLGVLAGFVVVLLRLIGISPRTQGVLIIVLVLGYLTLVEVRMPVLRAGVMTIFASLALVWGRRLRVSGLIGLSAILLLAWRPDQLFTPGFQLSFGVVFGIIHFAPILRKRWFGLPDMTASTSAQMIGQWLRTTLVITLTAWMIATPITAYHFGVISPLAVPLSVIALPMVAGLLGIGYTKMLLAFAMPSLAMLLGVPLSVGADALLSLVAAIDSLPFSALHVPYPSLTWSVAALAWVVFFIKAPRRINRLAKWPLLAGVVVWLVLPLWPRSQSLALRIDMLSVGDGSCYVLRSGDTTALFDAGSSTDLDAGRRVIIPALRRLGVRSIDLIAISHANLDHYSAVLELVDEFQVQEVLVTSQFLLAAEKDPLDAPAHLLGELTSRFVTVKTVATGSIRTLGDSQWTWLAPQAQARFARSNDESMVIRIEAAGRRVLMCGDVQREALAILLGMGEDALAADIIELPHHGSYSEMAREFLLRVDPQVIMQSTGPRRWEADRWADVLRGRERLITTRDGACVIGIDHEGGIRWERFAEERLERPGLLSDLPASGKM